MRTLSLIVPVYWNTRSLAILFHRIRDVEERLLEMGVALELIFVDDGSTDDSLAELAIDRPGLRSLLMPRIDPSS